MQKKLLFFVMAFLIVSIVVCGCQIEDEIKTEYEYQPQYDMNQDYNAYYPVCEKDGIYYFVMEDRIHYYDSHIDMTGILCSKAECMPEGKECNALQPTWLFLEMYDNQLYWLSGSYIDGKNGTTVLHQASLQGDKHEEIQDITIGLGGSPAMDIHRGYLYIQVVGKRVTEGDPECVVTITKVEMGNSDNGLFKRRSSLHL